jgi:hypothetical protein
MDWGMIVFLGLVALCGIQWARYSSPKARIERIMDTADFYHKTTGKPADECFRDAVETHKKIEG